MIENSLNTKNGLESTTISQEEVNNSNLYLDEKDSKGVPLLRRVEKYPDLSEDEFIPIEYCIPSGLIVPNRYLINKKGEIKNSTTGKLLKYGKNKKGYSIVGIILSKKRNTSIPVHRLVAFTFLINPDRNTYNIVNHKNHNREDFKLENLEFTTPADNSNISNGNSLGRSDSSLINYIATDPINGEELFKVNIKDTKGFNIKAIRSSIEDKGKHRGYIWKKDKSPVKDARDKMISLIGFSGNFDDYKWEKHWKYDDIYVCKEGFIRKGNRLVGGLDDKNYIVISSLKVNGKRIYTRAHRVLMEQWLGRDLKDDEVIDHIDGCPYNNNINNLRLTDTKGNMNNPVTINNRIRKLLLVDRFGDIVLCGSSRDICKFVYNDEDKLSCCNLIKVFLLDRKNSNYFCVDLYDNDSLLDKISKIIYVVSSNTGEIVDSFPGVYKLYLSKKYPFTQNNVYKYLNSNISKDGYYIIRGDRSVDILLKSGHLTALNYEPNKEIDLLNCTVRDYKINAVENFIDNTNSRRRAVSRYDLCGNLIKTYPNICSIESDTDLSVNKKVSVYPTLSGKRLTYLGYLWCEVGNESKIESDLKYICYKFDSNGHIVNAANNRYELLRYDTGCGHHSSYIRYFNTGVPAPDGFYYQQGDPKNMLKDPDNKNLIKKREIIKWKPKK